MSVCTATASTVFSVSAFASAAATPFAEVRGFSAEAGNSSAEARDCLSSKTLVLSAGSRALVELTSSLAPVFFVHAAPSVSLVPAVLAGDFGPSGKAAEFGFPTFSVFHALHVFSERSAR